MVGNLSYFNNCPGSMLKPLRGHVSTYLSTGRRSDTRKGDNAGASNPESDACGKLSRQRRISCGVQRFRAPAVRQTLILEGPQEARCRTT
eukprot:scaffold1347_cov350-Pavlova_lutheri.AAC.1